MSYLQRFSRSFAHSACLSRGVSCGFLLHASGIGVAKRMQKTLETLADRLHVSGSYPAYLAEVGRGPSPMPWGTACGGPVYPRPIHATRSYRQKWKVMSRIVGDLNGENKEGCRKVEGYFYDKPLSVVVLSLRWKFRGGWPLASPRRLLRYDSHGGKLKEEGTAGTVPQVFPLTRPAKAFGGVVLCLKV